MTTKALRQLIVAAGLRQSEIFKATADSDNPQTAAIHRAAAERVDLLIAILAAIDDNPAVLKIYAN